MNKRNLKRCKNTCKKKYFKNILGLLFSAREKVLNNFKIRLFPIKNLDKISTPEPAAVPGTEPEVAKEPTKAKTRRKISSLQFCEKFWNEIKNEDKI